MLADQENQENIPPPSGKAAPAGPRVALGLLRGPRQRPGAPLQAAAGRGQQPLGIRVDQPNGGKQPFAIRVDEVGGEKQPFSIHVDQPDAGKKPLAVRVDQPGGGKQPFAVHVDQPDGGKQPFSICLDEPDGGKQPFAIHVDKAGRGKQPLRIRVDEQDVRKQPFAILVDEPDKEKKPFSIHVDEPDEQQQRRQRRESPVAPKEDEEENALGLREAVCALGERRPLATLSNAVEMSFDSPSIMDISINPEEEEEEETPNVNNVPDYINDIHTYLREMEMKCKPKMGYMKKQPDITNNMRAILVDWLVEVGEEYKLQNETLHLAVNYIDRFLSSMSVLRGKLQLVGTAAMLLASKFEEIYPPEVAEFVYITDDTYTKKQVLRMEHLILKVLSFDLAAPTINQFLTQYFLHQQTNAKVESLAMYLGELSLIDADPYLKYLPSVIAAAAFHLAGYTITGQTWYLKNGNTDTPFLGRQRHLLMQSEEDHQNKAADSFLMVQKRVPESLCKVTGYTLEDIKPCLMDLHQTYLKAAQHTQQSIREKYKSTKYHGVSLIDAPETLNLL